MINYNFNNKNTSSARNPLFKGYFACPLKRIHIQSSDDIKNAVDIAKQLNKIGSQEGFETKLQVNTQVFPANNSDLTDNFVRSKLGDDYKEVGDIWGQDSKVFLNNGVLGILTKHCDAEHARNLAHALGIKTKDIESALEGGNFFLGVKPDKTRFALIGENDLINTAQDIHKNTKADSKGWDYLDSSKKQEYIEQAKSKIANELELDPNQVNYIPQPDFHLDLGIRPLKYPHILVNDPELFLNEVWNTKNVPYQTIRALQEAIKERKEECKKEGYISPEDMEKLLTSLGFKVTRVPGSVYEKQYKILKPFANYMNAIVHQKTDGSLVYIASKRKPFNAYNSDINFDSIFKEYLKNIPEIKGVKFPEIKRVEFIDIGDTLREKKGALHCMTAEEPNFDVYR